MKAAPSILVEVAVESVAGAVAAVRGGAQRIELCAALGEGGLTPSPGMVEAVAAAAGVPVMAMLRPRGGDFLYDDAELDVVLRDARALASAGATGFVFGALRPDGSVDREATSRVIEAADGRPVTFHRAFDLCREPFAALAQIAALGARRLLSSGQQASAPKGAELLRALVEAAPADLTILAGAGVRSTNVAALVAATGVREVHLSATAWTESAMQFRRAEVPMGADAASEYRRRTTSESEVAAVVAALR